MVTLICSYEGHLDCSGCDCPCHEIDELRCDSCGKLLAEKAASGTVIVCTRCKTRTARQ